MGHKDLEVYANEKGCSSPMVSELNQGPKPSVSDVVDLVGAGPAQARTLLLGTGGVNFCDGIELMLGNVIVMSVSSEFGLGPNQRALMSMMTLLGLMVGHFVSGYVGDTYGRRTPTVWCYMVSTVVGFVCAFMPSFPCLVVARALLGLGMGFGMPPALAMISEITPEGWRIAMRVGSSLSFSLGYLFITLVAAFDDPTYKNAHWRHLMLIAAVPSAVFWAVSWLFLMESPVFLAAINKHAEAKQVFRRMAWMNSTEHLDLDYAVPPGSNAPQDHADKEDPLSLRDQLRMLFSRRLWFTTVAVFWAAFCVNLVAYGDGYAAPQVLAVTSSLPPAWQCVIKAAISVCWTVVAGMLAQVCSRKLMVIVAAVISSSVCFAFAGAGSWPAPRPPFIAIIFQYGANCSSMGSALGYVVIFQIAVEIYPTAASTTGGALIMGGGRLAAIAAPLIFENMRGATGQWTPFYYLLGTASAVAAVLVAFMPPIQAYRPGEERLHDAESHGIAFQAPHEHGTSYGSAAKTK